jgi:AcrR family transcriptional regulator
VGTRRYEQRLRAQAADATRRRILDALYERLREAPSRPVGVDAIARAAGVARSTVYLVFGSRAGLFDALAADLFEREGYARLVQAVAEPDARESLRSSMRGGVEMLAADRDVARALFSMAALEAGPEGGAIRRMEAQRTRGIARLARRLAEQGALRPDVSREQAADLLWLLASFESFDVLSRRGLSADEVTRTLIATAERSLCR